MAKERGSKTGTGDRRGGGIWYNGCLMRLNRAWTMGKTRTPTTHGPSLPFENNAAASVPRPTSDPVPPPVIVTALMFCLPRVPESHPLQTVCSRQLPRRTHHKVVRQVRRQVLVQAFQPRPDVLALATPRRLKPNRHHLGNGNNAKARETPRERNGKPHESVRRVCRDKHKSYW